MVIDVIAVGINPNGVAYNPSNTDMYVSNQGSNIVSVIAPPTIANAGSDQSVHSFQTVQLNGLKFRS
jgi:DNA-binding beta-propeller fold protein YncE